MGSGASIRARGSSAFESVVVYQIEDDALKEGKITQVRRPGIGRVGGLALRLGALGGTVGALAAEEGLGGVGATVDHLRPLGGAKLVKARVRLLLVPHVVPLVEIGYTRSFVVYPRIICRNLRIEFVIIVNTGQKHGRDERAVEEACVGAPSAIHDDMGIVVYPRLLRRAEALVPPVANADGATGPASGVVVRAVVDRARAIRCAACAFDARGIFRATPHVIVVIRLQEVDSSLVDNPAGMIGIKMCVLSSHA